MTTDVSPPAAVKGSALEVLGVASRLGLTSFGGPVAHIGYFRAEYVGKRKWVDEATFADLVALAQFLPGAASSKLGIMLGILRAGLLGGVAAWIGFTLPSVVLLTIFALTLQSYGQQASGWLHGLQIVAVAAVAQAVWSMARSLAWDKERGTMALLAAAVILSWQHPAALVVVIVACGAWGWRRFIGAQPAATETRAHVHVPLSHAFWIGSAVLYFALLIGLPLARQVIPDQTLAMFDSFYRAGALVFGGGNVVLPLLQPEVVPPGWVSTDVFLAGYAAAQAVPGPLFTFAAFLGAASTVAPNGPLGAAVAVAGIFLPSFLLAFVALGSWGLLRSRPDVQALLRGVNAGVVGVLLAALYTPVGTNAILRPVDFALALVAFGALAIHKIPPWAVVLFTAAGGALITRLSP